MLPPAGHPRARLQHAAAGPAREPDPRRGRRGGDQGRAPRRGRGHARLSAAARRHGRKLRDAQPRQARHRAGPARARRGAVAARPGADVDIVLEQFRPGVMDRLGLGYAAWRAANPRIVYCAITGYGQDGPRAREAGHDLNYEARTGPPRAHGGRGRHAGHVARPGGRHRGRHLSRGDEHPARAAAPRPHGGGLLHRHRDVGEPLHVHVPGARDGLRRRRLAARRRRARSRAGRRAITSTARPMAGISPWPRSRTSSGRRSARSPACPRRFATMRATRRPRSRRWRSAWRRRMPRTGRRRWNATDTCCTVVRTLEEAVRDLHFKARGVFERKVEIPGHVLPALPVPVVPALRTPGASAGAPRVGQDNEAIIGPRIAG